MRRAAKARRQPPKLPGISHRNLPRRLLANSRHRPPMDIAKSFGRRDNVSFVFEAQFSGLSLRASDVNEIDVKTWTNDDLKVVLIHG